VRRTPLRSLGLCLLACLPPAAVAAQTLPDEAPPSTFQFGPLGLTPRIALKNLGFDSNPLNQSEGAQRDVTATVVPGLDSLLRVGRGLLSSKTSLEWNYFDKSSTQRSFNFGQEGALALDFYRLMPYIGGGYVQTRQRPNLEIDERVQQYNVSSLAGTAVRVGTRIRIDVEGRRNELEYGEGDYGSDAIATSLNRRVDVASVATRFNWTPLTTFVVQTEMQHDRFEFSPLRDSNSLTVLPGFELKPSALISGKVAAGFRQFHPLDSAVPDYAGIVAKVDAKYIFRQATEFAFKVERNVDYSIEVEQPYFVITGGTVSVTQIVGEAWYTAARMGLSSLAYREMLTARAGVDVAGSRTDRVNSYGGGGGRLLGTDLRIGVDIDYVSRSSTVASHAYEGLKVGGTISYGF
jgi:putative beta-barrel porin BBP2